jgi:hypothetical protein
VPPPADPEVPPFLGDSTLKDPSGSLDQASQVRLGSQIGQPTQEIPPPVPPPEPVDELLTTETAWPTVEDPSQQWQDEAGWAQPGGAAEEAAGYDAYQGFEDPMLTDPSLTEPVVPDEGFDDGLSP